jgi:beta-N-acetylhexosaminidase
MAEGVMAVIKHIPGHGRATVDSHDHLPHVGVSRATLEKTDFLPFKLLSDLPWAMTGHLLFEAIDPATPITISAGALQDVIRSHIGFDGLLLSDDLSMQALGGTLGERAARSIAAGCDVALHCNGRMDEMKQVAGRTGPLTERGWQRFQAGRSALARLHAPMPRAEASRRLASLLPEWG